jgi:hypothetical protein
MKTVWEAPQKHVQKHVFSHIWKTYPIQSFIVDMYKYIQNMFPKVGLLRETKGGRKEEKNDRE